MIRRPPRSTLDRSSAASDVYKRQCMYTGIMRIPTGSINNIYLSQSNDPRHRSNRYTHGEGWQPKYTNNKHNTQVLLQTDENHPSRSYIFHTSCSFKSQITSI